MVDSICISVKLFIFISFELNVSSPSCHNLSQFLKNANHFYVFFLFGSIMLTSLKALWRKLESLSPLADTENLAESKNKCFFH